MVFIGKWPMSNLLMMLSTHATVNHDIVPPNHNTLGSRKSMIPSVRSTSSSSMISTFPKFFGLHLQLLTWSRFRGSSPMVGWFHKVEDLHNRLIYLIWFLPPLHPTRFSLYLESFSQKSPTFVCFWVFSICGRICWYISNLYVFYVGYVNPHKKIECYDNKIRWYILKIWS
jgi:hypothetical protein